MDGFENFKFKRYGAPARSNVKWVYNFGPIKMVMSCAMVALSAYSIYSIFISQEKPRQTRKVEAVTAKIEHQGKPQLYSWINEKGNKVYSNKPPHDVKYTNLKIEY